MEEINEVNKTKRNKSTRERETLFRCAYRNQTSLRQIIDNKAKIIISINTVLISSIIAISGFGIVTDHMELYRFNLLPLVIIILCALVSAIFAILAAMPKLIKPQDKLLQTEKQSLIFFGEIVSYTQKEYTDKIEALLNSRKEIYEHMAIDIYNQGLVLKKKYNLLSYAYKVLMYGIGFGVMGFLILLFLN
jgi:hypothetical protein